MLKTQSLSHKIDGKYLIRNISIEFSKGILHGILGPNGSGKSTLLKTLCGIWKPFDGQVLWNETNLLQQTRRQISQIITLVPQNPQIFFDFTVEELVSMGRYANGKGYTQTQMDNVLKNVDAWHLRERNVNTLSSGERQKVYIARALISESPILLLDEPTSSLDIRHQIDIWHLLKNLTLDGKMVIVTTHDLSAAERFCSKVSLLNHGECLGSGEFSNVINAKRLEEVFGLQKESLHESLVCRQNSVNLI